MMNSLVSTPWLADNLGAPDLKVLDASAHLPDAGRDAAAYFDRQHIPGARYMALKSLVDNDSAVPTALPTSAQFAEHMASLGVSESDRVVLYDDSDIRSSARGWFMCRMHGMQNVAVLDGGLGKWMAEGREVESGQGDIQATSFVASSSGGAVRSKADMFANVASGAEQVVDARGAARFTGEVAEPRPGMARGHIPRSRNLPFGQVMNADGTYKDEAGIRAAFAAAGVDVDRPLVATCGSGVTASVLLFALHLIGADNCAALYDGSWAEWGADPSLPKETGDAA